MTRWRKRPGHKQPLFWHVIYLLECYTYAQKRFNLWVFDFNCVGKCVFEHRYLLRSAWYDKKWVTISCHIYRYHWLKNKEDLIFNDRVTVASGNNGTLMIQQAGKEDEGYYQCQAINTYGTALSDVTQLEMAGTEVYKKIQSLCNFLSNISLIWVTWRGHRRGVHFRNCSTITSHGCLIFTMEILTRKDGLYIETPEW